MSHHSVGSVLETRNKEVVKKLDDLKNKRAELQRDIHSSELHKTELESHIDLVRDRIAQIRTSLALKTELRGEYAQLVTQIDEAYNVILNESQTLISHLDLNTTRITDALKAKPAPVAVASSSRHQEPPALLLQHHSPPALHAAANGEDHYSAPASTRYTAPYPSKAAAPAPPAAAAVQHFDDSAYADLPEDELLDTAAAGEKQLASAQPLSDIAADKVDQLAM